MSALNRAAGTIWGEISLGCDEEILKLKASFVWDHGNFLHFPRKCFELTQKDPHSHTLKHRHSMWTQVLKQL